jgi:hypothetical protein
MTAPKARGFRNGNARPPGRYAPTSAWRAFLKRLQTLPQNELVRQAIEPAAVAGSVCRRFETSRRREVVFLLCSHPGRLAISARLCPGQAETIEPLLKFEPW